MNIDNNYIYIYGHFPVREALLNNRPARIIYFGGRVGYWKEKLFKIAKTRGIKVIKTERKLLDRLVGCNSHQGVVALVKGYSYSTPQKLWSRCGPVVVLNSIEDPRNLGAILRTIESVKGAGVVLPARCAVKITASVVKASAGAVEYVPIVKVDKLSLFLSCLKQRGYQVAAFTSEAKTPYFDVKFKEKIALLFGGEGKGLNKELLKSSDLILNIPQEGKITSLNLSVAVALGLYEVVRQQKLQNKI